MGDADHGATRIASAFSLACIHSPVVVCPRTLLLAGEEFLQIMSKGNFNPGEDRFIRGIIRRKAMQLVGRAGYTDQDRPDLEQELFLRVFKSLRRFNPLLAHRNRFITAVVERHTANLIRRSRAQKRDHRRAVSIHITVAESSSGPVELAQTLSDADGDARHGRRRRSDQELAELRHDLAVVIAQLPDNWRLLVELRKTMSMPRIARVMGVPRTTLNGWMRKIRRRFEVAGLREYLLD